MKSYRYWIACIICLLVTTGVVLAQDDDPIIQSLDDSILFNGPIVDMAINPTDEQIAVADESLTFTLLNLADATSINQHTIGTGNLFLEDGVHYNSDGSLIAVGTFSSVLVFDGTTGALRYELSGTVDDLAFSPDGMQVYILSRDSVSAYESASGTLLGSIAVGEDGDGRTAADLEVLGDGTLVLLVPDASFEYYVATVPADLSSVTMTPVTGRILAAAGETLVTAFYANLTAYPMLSETGLPLAANAPCKDFTAFDFNTDATLFAALAGNCGLHVFDVATGAQIYSESLEGVNAIAFGTDVLYVGTGAALNGYSVELAADASSTAVTAESTVETSSDVVPTEEAVIEAPSAINITYQLDFMTRIGAEYGFAGVAVSPDGSKVAGITGFSSEVIAYNTVDNSLIGIFANNGGSSNVSYSADGSTLIAIDSESRLHVLDASTMQLMHEILLDELYQHNLIVDDNFAYFTSTNGMREDPKYLYKVDISTGDVIAKVEAYVEGTVPSEVTWNDDGTFNLVVPFNTIMTWDTDLNLVNSAEMGSYWDVIDIGQGVLAMTSRRENDANVFIFNHQDALHAEPISMGESDCLLSEFATSSDGGFTVGTAFRCGMILFNLNTKNIDAEINGDNVGSDVELSPDNQVLYVATRDGIHIYTITAVTQE